MLNPSTAKAKGRNPKGGVPTRVGLRSGRGRQEVASRATSRGVETPVEEVGCEEEEMVDAGSQEKETGAEKGNAMEVDVEKGAGGEKEGLAEVTREGDDQASSESI